MKVKFGRPRNVENRLGCSIRLLGGPMVQVEFETFVRGGPFTPAIRFLRSIECKGGVPRGEIKLQ